MITDPLYNRLCEVNWRRKLTASEQAELRTWLLKHPEALADWEAEAGLTETLGRIPDAPLSSNFTALVLQAVKREVDAREQGKPWWRTQRWWRWLPRGAFAAVVAAAALLGYRHHEQTIRNREYAQSITAVSDVPSLPSPSILTNFDAVWVLNQAPGPDVQLLTLMR